MTKILIDEAVVRQALEALEEINYRIQRDLEHDHEWAVVERELGNEAITALRQALANAALDKMADNARELGLSYEQPAPAQPLTDEQIDDIWNACCDEMGYVSINDAYDIARAIEAAHGIGEKNG